MIIPIFDKDDGVRAFVAEGVFDWQASNMYFLIRNTTCGAGSIGFCANT